MTAPRDSASHPHPAAPAGYAESTDLLLVPAEQCAMCPAMPLLLAPTRAGRVCVRCWLSLPEPLRWLPPSTMEQTHAAEVKAREAMQRRGGTDKHLVRAGLS